jgi:DNA-binding response OmpR family regulator
MPTVITIEDDRAIRVGICDTLKFAGYRVDGFGDGDSGMTAALSTDYDLLLLDLVLPGKSGMEILAKVRELRPTCPVIILSAKGEEADRVRGLRAGADDYITKPFGVDELLARVEAVLRRSPSRREPAAAVKMGVYEIDLSRNEIRSPGELEGLTPRESEVIRYLAIHRERTIPREELLANVWHIDPRGSNTRVVDITISRLREKLKLSPDALRTVHGKGYLLGDAAQVSMDENANK